WFSLSSCIVQFDAVGNNAILCGKVVRDKRVGRAGHSDAAIKVAQHWSQQWYERSIGQVEGRSQTDLRRGVKGAYGYRLRTPERGQRKAGYKRFVDMQNIKVFTL